MRGLAKALQTTPEHLMRLYGYGERETEGEPSEEHPMTVLVTSLARETDWDNLTPRDRRLIEETIRVARDRSHEREMPPGGDQ